MIGAAQVFALFFVTLGPLKVLGPFAQRTSGLDAVTTRRIAVHAYVMGTVAVVLSGFLGSRLLAAWQISLPALEIAGGIILFLVAIRQLLAQYEPAHPPATETLPAAPTAAALRLVFPTVLTPYGIAAVIALVAASPGTERTAVLVGLLLLVMSLDLLAMLFAQRILVGVTIVILQILGAILGVMQVALSVQFMLAGLRSLGAPAG